MDVQCPKFAFCIDVWVGWGQSYVKKIIAGFVYICKAPKTKPCAREDNVPFHMYA